MKVCILHMQVRVYNVSGQPIKIWCKSPLLVLALMDNFFLLGLMDTHLSLQSHRFVMAMLPGLIPTPLVRLLATLLLWHLVALLDRLLKAFLCWLLPTLGLRDINTNLPRHRDAALLGYPM